MDYFSIYNNSWKNIEPYPTFIKSFIYSAADNGWLRLGIMYIDDAPAAAQIWFVQNGSAYIYKLAYDDGYAEWSPGTQLSFHMLKYVTSNDCVTTIDYLTGDDTYKSDWMDYSRPLYKVTVINVINPRGLIYLFSSLCRKFYSHLNGMIPFSMQ